MPLQKSIDADASGVAHPKAFGDVTGKVGMLWGEDHLALRIDAEIRWFHDVSAYREGLSDLPAEREKIDGLTLHEGSEDFAAVIAAMHGAIAAEQSVAEAFDKAVEDVVAGRRSGERRVQKQKRRNLRKERKAARHAAAVTESEKLTGAEKEAIALSGAGKAKGA